MWSSGPYPGDLAILQLITSLLDSQLAHCTASHHPCTCSSSHTGSAFFYQFMPTGFFWLTLLPVSNTLPAKMNVASEFISFRSLPKCHSLKISFITVSKIGSAPLSNPSALFHFPHNSNIWCIMCYLFSVFTPTRGELHKDVFHNWSSVGTWEPLGSMQWVWTWWSVDWLHCLQHSPSILSNHGCQHPEPDWGGHGGEWSFTLRLGC